MTKSKKREKKTVVDEIEPQEVLPVADACFEVFTQRELAIAFQVVHEINRSHPHLSADQIRETLELAVSWKHMLRATSQMIN